MSTFVLLISTLVISQVVLTIYIQPKIIGGYQVINRSAFAYQVSLRYRSKHFCGGAILDERNVITAAHCLYGVSLSHLSIVAGDLNMKRQSSNTVTKNIQAVFLHENYTQATFSNDIAILRIKGEFFMTSSIQPIPLWNNNTLSNASVSCVVSGWGVTNDSKMPSEQLMAAEIPLVDTGICRRNYGQSIKEGMVCAGFMNTGVKDACEGDSGGPLVCETKLIGIVSWGYHCAKSGFPGVYTDVRKFSVWIKQQQFRSSAHINLHPTIYLIFLVLAKAFI